MCIIYMCNIYIHCQVVYIYYVLRCVLRVYSLLFFTATVAWSTPAVYRRRINYRQGASGKRQEVSYPI